MTSRAVMGRIAALFLLVLLLGGAGAVVVTPVVMAFQSYDDSIRDLGARRLTYERMAARMGPLQADLARLETERPEDADLLGGGNDSLAGAELQDIVKKIVVGNGGKLESTQILPAQTEGSLGRVMVRTRFSATVPMLQRILHAIESGRPLLFVDSIEIRSGAPRSAAARRTSARRIKQAGAAGLKLTIEFFGYRRGGEAS